MIRRILIAVGILLGVLFVLPAPPASAHTHLGSGSWATARCPTINEDQYEYSNGTGAGYPPHSDTQPGPEVWDYFDGTNNGNLPCVRGDGRGRHGHLVTAYTVTNTAQPPDWCGSNHYPARYTAAGGTAGANGRMIYWFTTPNYNLQPSTTETVYAGWDASGNPYYENAYTAGRRFYTACGTRNYENPPATGSDTISTAPNTSNSVDTKLNDTSYDHDFRSWSITAQPSGGIGSVSIDANGIATFSATNSPGTSGSATYRVCSEHGCTNGTITVTVTGVAATTPILRDDTYDITSSVITQLPVLSNDSSNDGNGWNGSAPTANGALPSGVVKNGARFDFTPPAGYFGTYTFRYDACNAANLCNPGANAATVTLIDRRPTATNDSYNITTGGTAQLTVLNNDSHNSSSWDGNAPTSGSLPSGVTKNGNRFDYAVPATPFATFSFNYSACNAHGACATATVTVTDGRVSSPTLNPDFYDVITWGPNVLDVLANDSHNATGWQAGTPAIVGSPPTGVTDNGATLSYQPPGANFADFNFSYQACNNGGVCSTATVTIRDRRVFLANDTYNISSNGTAQLTVLNNDSSGSGSWAASAPTANGALPAGVSKNGNRFDFVVPAAPFASFTFRYDACNSMGGCNNGPATVTVNDARNFPTANNDTYDVTSNSAITMNALSNDSHNSTGWDASSPNCSGACPAGVTDAGATFSYTPPANTPFANFSFGYQACNASGSCASATITVRDARPLPALNNDSYSVTTSGTFSMPALSNDTHNSTGWSGSSPDANGALPSGVTDAGTTFSYAVPSGNFATFSFSYRACNVQGGCSTATVTVSDGRSRPTLTNDSYSVPSAATVPMAVLTNDSHNASSWDAGSPTIVGPTPAGLVKNGNRFDYTVPRNGSHFAPFTFQYMGCNNLGACATNPATVTVNDTRPDPTVNNDSITVPLNTAVNFDVLANDVGGGGSSIDRTSRAFTTGMSPNNALGAPGWNAANNFTWPGSSTNGTYTIGYSVWNASGIRGTATITITVQSLPPTANPDTLTVAPNSTGYRNVLANDVDNSATGLNAAGVQIYNGSTWVSGSVSNSYGTFTVNPAGQPAGTIQFTAVNGGEYTTSIQYRVCDNSGQPPANSCSTSTLTTSFLYNRPR